MEEILASIRRIISEDEAPAPAAGPEAVALEPEPEAVAAMHAPEPEPEPEPELAQEDVLELTNRVEPPKETVGDIDVYDGADAEPAAAPAAAVSAAATEEEERLVSEPSAYAAATHFSQLSAAILMPAEGRTLEDLTRELLRPLLKAWLDQHLPRIVEAKVAEEVERIARTRVR